MSTADASAVPTWRQAGGGPFRAVMAAALAVRAQEHDAVIEDKVTVASTG
ncbi:MAG: hypothetical protein M0007_06120 [Actinomycetota bacterium]|nr:hypothetical protein [Actinomycetota bacterium]